MRLRRFNYKLKENKKKPLIISGLLVMVLLIGVTIYATYAEYKVTNSYNIIEGEVDFFEKRDLTVAVKLVDNDGNATYVEEIPTEGYVFDAEKSYCINGSTISFANGKATVGEIVGKEKCTIYFRELGAFAKAIIANSTIIETTPDFSVPATDTNKNLYKAQDDLGTSYYFRGAATNNYVKFGGDIIYDVKFANGGYFGFRASTLEECETSKEQAAASGLIDASEQCIKVVQTQLYWRIVRINGDGTIRMIYDGTEKVANGVAHVATTSSAEFFNEGSVSESVSYTYDDGTGVQTSSIAKLVVEDWYESHMKGKYDQYLADAIFCNDRSMSGSNYAAGVRLFNNPQLICSNKSDRYTKSEDIGNGYLTYPIGHITADEVVMAGTTGSTNKSNYIYIGYDYWTMTPGSSDMMWAIMDDGEDLHTYYSMYSLASRPVINLKADVLFEGDGSYETPYEIVTD